MLFCFQSLLDLTQHSFDFSDFFFHIFKVFIKLFLLHVSSVFWCWNLLIGASNLDEFLLYCFQFKRYGLEGNVLVFYGSVSLRSTFFQGLMYFLEPSFDHLVVLVNCFLNRMDKTEPVFLFPINHHITGLHKYHKFYFFEISVQLIFDLKVVKVDFGLVNVAIDLSLIYYPFICLGNDSNKVIEQNDDHKHCLGKPNAPYKNYHGITRYWTYLSGLSLKEPRVIIRGSKVSD